MSYTAKQILDLQSELVNDPLTKGYSGMTDQLVADSLLDKTRERNRESMTRQEIYEKIEPSALDGLTNLELAQINLALSDAVDPFGNAVQVFKNVFGDPSATVTALAAARKESISRLTEIGLSDIENISLVGWIAELRAA